MYNIQKIQTSLLLKYGLGRYYSKEDLFPKKILIRKVLMNDIPDVLNIFQQNFAQCEPLFKGLQFPENQYSPALKEFWRNSIDQGMSYIAVPSDLEKTNNKLGVVVNTKILPWEPDDWWKFATCIKCPKTRDLITLYGFLIKDSEMHKRFNAEKYFNITHVVENQMKCKEYNEDPMNVSLALVANSLLMGKLLGYEYGSLLCASNKLSDIANNLEMDLIYEYPCDKLVNDKLEPILHNTEPNSFVRVYIKELIKKPKPIIDPN